MFDFLEGIVGFKEGERILVSNGSDKMEKRIFIGNAKDGAVLCVHSADEDAYRNGEYFRVGKWSVAEEWVPTYGDTVEVSNGGDVFKERIFLGCIGNKFLTVHNSDVDKFNEGANTFKTALWNLIR